MNFLDLHCDTVTELYERGENLADNTCHISLRQADAFDQYLQTYAIWIDPTLCAQDAYRRFHQLYGCYRDQLDRNPCVKEIRCWRDYASTQGKARRFALLSIENASCFAEPERCVDEFYRLGVRMVSLTHTADNAFACGNETTDDRGLTPAGRKLVAMCEKKGYILDVSHLSFRSFWDFVECSERPFVASHSNSHAICAHPRNLTDEMFRAVVERGGIVGLNLYSRFLRGESASIDSLLLHLERFLELGGEHTVAFGCDFDGIGLMPKEMHGLRDIPKIAERMQTLHYPQQLIDDLFWNNALNFIREQIK
ncbi:dipeptidase [Feifania hominis]|uniref:Membrane dipeptidase n=1 Tax=Feifania hominis TaxID=2763660 RepID=A0A926DE21_9FIRM|nr:membrane dipeptidase [Feifania hominis]MBC8535604.1 membrane dipeptidase [Feifania hominis]